MTFNKCPVCGLLLIKTDGKEICPYCGYGSVGESDCVSVSDYKTVVENNKNIAEQCRNNLMNNVDGSWDYLIGRDITKATAEKWCLGYVPEGFDLLPFSWHNRILFPIIKNKAIVGFGGRILPEKQKDLPKYLNSGKSDIYQKDKTLYGMHLIEDRVVENVYLCEGYMDAISMNSFCSVPAVASCGTSLTRNQAMFLRNHTTRVSVSYDSDDAGRTATLRAVEVLWKAGFRSSEISVITPVGAKDVDEAVKTGKPIKEDALTAYLINSGDGNKIIDALIHERSL